MTKPLSRIAPVLPLLLSTAVFTSDTGKELVQLDPPQATASLELDVTPLEYDPVASSCSAGTELTLRRVQDDPGGSSQFTCAALSDREVRGASSYSCVAYAWGWKCFYPDRFCYFFYTGGVYCYLYADQNGW